MYISNASKTEIIWWSHNVRTLNGKPIRPSPVQFWIETDASLQGWGACLDDKTSGGRWTNMESTYHINYLELLSIFNALKALCANSNKCHIGIKSENSTAASYINNMGGMTSEALAVKSGLGALTETYLYLLSIFQETLTHKQILYHDISLTI